jgi:hypothetical protein
LRTATHLITCLWGVSLSRLIRALCSSDYVEISFACMNEKHLAASDFAVVFDFCLDLYLQKHRTLFLQYVEHNDR